VNVQPVYVDPRCKIPYYTYLLEGLDAAGLDWKFRRLDAPVGAGMAIHHQSTRIWVDTDDMAHVDESAYNWADRVGKVNVLLEDLQAYPKIVPLGPVFGIRCWQRAQCFGAFLAVVAHGVRPRAAISALRFQAKAREGIEAYFPVHTSSGTVFHRSRPWSGRHSGTNDARARFATAAENANVLTDISFAASRISLAEYLERLRTSSVAFNSPAVHQCLGWKLGEYLAMGKAIISTDLAQHALPAPLVHGQHVHFVDDDVESMRAAIVRIDQDDEYRRRLERGSREWFEDHLAPRRVIERLLKSDCTRGG